MPVLWLGHHMNSGCILLGDMNCGFGSLVRQLPARIRSTNLSDSVSITDLSYSILSDDIIAVNNNAELLFTICSENNLIVVNNLKSSDKHFPSNNTYKKKNTWISELDTCTISIICK